MSVIGPSCAIPSEDSPGCGRVSKDITGGRLAGAATATALVAAACTACCVLPFTLPTAVLALAGGSIAVLDHARGWVTKLAIVLVLFAWSWIAWQRRRSGRMTRLTLALMLLATLLTATAAAWPRLEPLTFHALGIVKKKISHSNE
jgi:cytochrome bd-type quinol oxidase subunit 2